MKTIFNIFWAIIKSAGKVIWHILKTLAPLIQALLSFTIIVMILAIPAWLLYTFLVVPGIASVKLPEIGYITWCGIIAIVRLIVGHQQPITFIPKSNTELLVDAKEKPKKTRTKPIDADLLRS